MDLDALLGPKQGTRVVGVMPMPSKERGCDVVIDVSQKQKQAKLTHFAVTVKKLDESEKAERAEAKRKRVDEQEQLRERTRREALEAEVEGTTRFLEQLEEEAKRFREEEDEERKKIREAWEAQHIVRPDGTEKPSSFEWNEEIVGADDARANKLDALIPVTAYYEQDVFPLDTLVNFMTQNGRIPLDQCEVGVVIKGTWWRNKRFKNADEWRRFISTMHPERIDIGPIHPHNVVPGSKESHSRLALRRYLVFDVDLEDRSLERPRGYIRNCACKGTKAVCSTWCWFYMRTAVKTLTYLLRMALGAKHILPVFSGRRGVHVWVLDETFLEYTEDDRNGILKRILLFGSPDKYYHDEYSAYLEEFILRPEFYATFLDGPLLIKDPASHVCLMECASPLPPSFVGVFASHVANVTRHDVNPVQRAALWKQACLAVDVARGEPEGYMERRFVFAMLFPRLDGEVTTQMNHCVKAPFAMHPATKRCSIPIPDIDTWRPHMAPRISSLIKLPPNPKEKPRQSNYPEADAWVEAKEQELRDVVLVPFVHHVQGMLREAYPLRVHRMPSSFSLERGTMKFY